MRKLYHGAFCALTLAALAAAQPADVILHNAKIVTVDAKFSIARAMAIRGERIAAIGTDADVMRLKGPATRVIDLGGKTVLPGLIDSHVHTLSAALSEFRGPLPRIDSVPALQTYIRERAKSTPPGEWIVVPLTFPTRIGELRMPVRADLDVTDRPVLFNASYTVVLNSAGLRRCGITRDTPNPPGGEIVRDAAGEPLGILKNAMSLLKGVPPPTPATDDEKLAAVEAQLKRYVDAGLTAVSDRAVTEEDIAIFRKLEAAGRLPIRVVMTWRIDWTRPQDELVAQIRARKETTGDGTPWLKFGAFKVTMDGGMTIGTAFQRIPYGPFGEQLYGRMKPDDRGLRFFTPEKLAAVFGAAADKGWQLTAHCQGGGAIDQFIDAIEAIDRAKPGWARKSRSHLMHSSFQSPEAIARAARLGLGADVQTPWLVHDAPALSRVFGPGPMRHFIPLASYIKAGIHPAGGSDHMIGHDKNKSTNPYNPFEQMWGAIARQMTNGTILAPEERISRADALRMHTIWAAEMQFAERDRGSLETGKLADFVVTVNDYLASSDAGLRASNPAEVWIGGVRRR